MARRAAVPFDSGNWLRHWEEYRVPGDDCRAGDGGRFLAGDAEPGEGQGGGARLCRERRIRDGRRDAALAVRWRANSICSFAIWCWSMSPICDSSLPKRRVVCRQAASSFCASCIPSGSMKGRWRTSAARARRRRWRRLCITFRNSPQRRRRAGFAMTRFDERWHGDDAGRPPRLAAFLFRLG